MKKYILGLILINIVFLTACENIDVSKVSDEDLARLSEKAVVCNEPYIRFGTSCCLDQNNNKICDRDERQLTEEEKEKEKDVNKETPSGITPPVTETPTEPTHPEKFIGACSIGNEFSCEDFKVEPTKTSLLIQNAVGDTIKLTSIQIGDCKNIFNQLMSTRMEKSFILTNCNNGAIGTKFDEVITIEYYTTKAGPGYPHKAQGSLTTKVEAGQVAIEEPQISWGFTHGEPPEEVTLISVNDRGTSPFDVGIELTNNGNYNIEKIVIELVGFIPEDFGKTKSDMIVNVGILKPSESKVFTFSGLNYKGTLQGNQQFTIRAKINYEYLGKGYEESKDVELLVKHLLEPIESTIGIDLSNFPDFFIQNNNFYGEIIVSDKASAEEVISASDIAVSLQFSKDGTQRIDVGATKLASEILNINKINAILIGTACNNPLIAEILNNPTDCKSGLQAGIGRIDLYESNGKVYLIVSGGTPADIRGTAVVLANYKDYDLKGISIEVRNGVLIGSAE